MTDDAFVLLQHLLDLDLRLADEDELMPDGVWRPHPEIGLVREEGWWNQPPAADELPINKAGVDLAEGLAVVEDLRFSLGEWAIEDRDHSGDAFIT